MLVQCAIICAVQHTKHTSAPWISTTYTHILQLKNKAHTHISKDIAHSCGVLWFDSMFMRRGGEENCSKLSADPQSACSMHATNKQRNIFIFNFNSILSTLQRCHIRLSFYNWWTYAFVLICYLLKPFD